jgi:hypothetical protein
MLFTPPPPPSRLRFSNISKTFFPVQNNCFDGRPVVFLTVENYDFFETLYFTVSNPQIINCFNTKRRLNSLKRNMIIWTFGKSVENQSGDHSAPWLETFSLTFTANVKPQTKFFIYNSIITAFTPVLKYIKPLLNLCSLAMI